MPLNSLFQKRFSCRAFSSEEVTGSEIDTIVEAGIWAPSAGNRQPWRFLVVTSQTLRQALAQAAFNQSFVAQAPVVFVVCAVPEESSDRYGQRGRELYCLQDTAAAVENMMLAATECGLGSCWIGAFSETAAAQSLDLPESWRPVAMVPVGHLAESPGHRSRRSRDQVVIFKN